MPADPSDYCREIEKYLCRKNDGHLIRIVGPSFELVAGWAARGIPLSIAYQGIDRSVERYRRKGPRRRPVRIDFCDADVLDVFDEWRRALGLVAASSAGDESPGDGGATAESPGAVSVPAHLERAVLKLTTARATGRIGVEADSIIDRLNDELERARASRGGVRGEARRALAGRLAALDEEMIGLAWGALPAEEQQACTREAARDLEPYRAAMTSEHYARALNAAAQRRVRERAGLPVLTLV